MAAASAARSSWVSTVTAFATGPAICLAPANRAAPRMNDKREEIEIRIIVIVNLRKSNIDATCAQADPGLPEDLCELCAFAITWSSSGEFLAKAQSSQSFFPELSIYEAAL